MITTEIYTKTISPPGSVITKLVIKLLIKNFIAKINKWTVPNALNKVVNNLFKCFTLQFLSEYFPWSFSHVPDISSQHQAETKEHKTFSHNQCY